MRPQLLRWQWDGYPTFHTRKLNLFIHIVAVPLFAASFFNLLWCLGHLWGVGAAISAVGMALGFGVQGLGHGREANPAIPFDGPGDAVSRIFAEQLITFPRFVLSGRWWRALKAGRN